VEDPFTVLSALVPEPEPPHPLVEPLVQVPDSSPDTAPAPVNLSLKRAQPDISVPLTPNKKRKHWDIIRNFNPRKSKEKEDDEPQQNPDGPPTNRKAHHLDYGVYATLQETLLRASSSKNNLENESSLFRLIRSQAYPRAHGSTPEAENVYFSHENALIADKYILDTVYGGPDGLAYIRSVAEFLDYHHDVRLPILESCVYSLKSLHPDPTSTRTL
jgi:bromodomain-containing protein 7